MTSMAEPFERVDVDRAKELIESGDIVLIDVREQEEWDAGYIDGATRISVNDIISMTAVDDLPKSSPSSSTAPVASAPPSPPNSPPPLASPAPSTTWRAASMPGKKPVTPPNRTNSAIPAFGSAPPPRGGLGWGAARGHMSSHNRRDVTNDH